MVYRVTFTETVSGVDASDFLANVLSGSVVAGIGSPTSSDGGVSWAVPVSVSGNGVVRLDLMDDNSIVDQTSNPFEGPGIQNFTAGQSYTIDQIAPSVGSIHRGSPSNQFTSDAAVTFTVTFSEAVLAVLRPTISSSRK